MRADGDDGRQIDLGPRRQRVVMALLLCHANDVLTVERLGDLTWLANPPASYRANVHTYIHRLRVALGGPGRIRRHQGGYVLDVGDGEIDAERFERLVTEAEDSAEAGATAELLREGLALWHGEPYANVDDALDIEPLRNEITRLAELRALAWEACIDAELALGRHHQLVPELTVLTSQHPYRERFHAQLMTALYRAGRAPDALAAYRRARGLFVDELGIEPSADLRRLEHAIVNDDDTLTLRPEPIAARAAAAPPVTSSTQPARSSGVTPRELPPRTATFVGRGTERETLATALRSPTAGPGIWAIDGAGGVGKSALAIDVAHEVSDAFPDGQLYVNLHGATPGLEPRRPEDVVARFLRALGVTGTMIPREPDDAAALYRSVTNDRRLLVVLDDAFDSAQVRSLLPSGEGSGAIVTCRMRLSALDSTSPLHLGSLPDDDALELLGRLSGDDRVALDRESAREVVALCDRLPLALRVAGGRLGARDRWTLAEFAARLGEAERRLDELYDSDLSVRACIEVGVRNVGDDATGRDAARLFQLLGLLDVGDFGLVSAAALADRDPRQTQAVLDRLVTAQLVEPLDRQRYRLHDLSRLCAGELVLEHVPGDERRAAVERVVHSYIATARRATGMTAQAISMARCEIGPQELKHEGMSFDDVDEIDRWIDDERANIVTIVRHAIALDGDAGSTAGALVAAVDRPLVTRGWHTEIALNNALLIDATDAQAAPVAHLFAHHDLGHVHRLRGQHDEAIDHMERSLELARTVDSPVLESVTAMSLANILIQADPVGQFHQAVALAERATAHWRQGHDRSGLAGALNNLGTVYSRGGDRDTALARYEEESAALWRDDDDGEGLGVALMNAGHLLIRRGEPARAVHRLQEALAALSNVRLRAQVAHGHWLLGTAHAATGDDQTARAEWRTSLAMLHEMGTITTAEMAAILAEPQPSKPPILDRL